MPFLLFSEFFFATDKMVNDSSPPALYGFKRALDLQDTKIYYTCLLTCWFLLSGVVALYYKRPVHDLINSIYLFAVLAQTVKFYFFRVHWDKQRGFGSGTVVLTSEVSRAGSRAASRAGSPLRGSPRSAGSSANADSFSSRALSSEGQQDSLLSETPAEPPFEMEKTPEFYNIFHTAEGWAMHMRDLQEYMVLMVGFRVSNLDQFLRTSFGTCEMIPRTELDASFHQSLFLQLFIFFLSKIVVEFGARPCSLFTKELLIWNFPHSVMPAKLEFFSLGGKSCFHVARGVRNAAGDDVADECVICLDNLRQKVSWVGANDRMQLSMSRQQPKFRGSSLRKRKVEHSGEIVGRLEVGLETHKSMWAMAQQRGVAGRRLGTTGALAFAYSDNSLPGDSEDRSERRLPWNYYSGQEWVEQRRALFGNSFQGVVGASGGPANSAEGGGSSSSARGAALAARRGAVSGEGALLGERARLVASVVADGRDDIAGAAVPAAAALASNNSQMQSRAPGTSYSVWLIGSRLKAAFGGCGCAHRLRCPGREAVAPPPQQPQSPSALRLPEQRSMSPPPAHQLSGDQLAGENSLLLFPPLSQNEPSEADLLTEQETLLGPIWGLGPSQYQLDRLNLEGVFQFEDQQFGEEDFCLRALWNFFWWVASGEIILSALHAFRDNLPRARRRRRAGAVLVQGGDDSSLSSARFEDVRLSAAEDLSLSSDERGGPRIVGRPPVVTPRLPECPFTDNVLML